MGVPEGTTADIDRADATAEKVMHAATHRADDSRDGTPKEVQPA